MGMKEITLPKELFNLPQPWGETDFLRRHQQLDMLDYQASEIKTALNVLERCLHTLSLFPPPSEDSIPESLTEYWSFTARWLADEMPTFDEFRLLKIERKLQEYGIDPPSKSLTLELGKYWLWSVVFDIADSALYWIQRAFQATHDPILISRFLHIASRYWHKISPDLAQSLLSRGAMIGRQEAFPLLESVVQHPHASKAVKETAQHYHQFVMKHPEKWLPDSPRQRGAEASEEMSANKNKQLVRRITQPALGQLVYG